MERGGDGRRAGQRQRAGGARRAGSSAKTLEQPMRTYVTTLSEGESLLTAWYQRGGGGRVQAQEICLFTDNFIRNSVCERQNVIQPAQKIRWYLFILVLHLHELDGQALPPLLIRQ